MFITLAWINVALMIIASLLFITRRIFKKLGDKKSPFALFLRRIMPLLQKIHPIIGLSFIVVSFIHGYLALGLITLHTGLLVWLTALLMGTVATVGKGLRINQKTWLKIHRPLALLLWALFFLHYFNPWLI